MTTRTLLAALALSLGWVPLTAEPSHVPSGAAGRMQQRLHRAADDLGQLQRSLQRDPAGVAAEEVEAWLDELERRIGLLREETRGLDHPLAPTLHRKATLLESRLLRLATQTSQPPRKPVGGPPGPSPDSAFRGVVANDECTTALPLGHGTVSGNTTGASTDNVSYCGSEAPSVWYRYQAPVDETVFFFVDAPSFDAALSAHGGCPATPANEIICNDDYTGLNPGFILDLGAGQEIWLRVAGLYDGEEGPFTLDAGPPSGIRGTVVDRDGEPIPYLDLELYDENGWWVDWTYTDEEGVYEFLALVPDTYYVGTDAYDYLNEVYDDVPCHGYPCDVLAGTPVEVSAGTIVTGVDFELSAGGVVSGTVTKASNGYPLYACVSLYDEDGILVGEDCADYDGEGSYAITLVPPGTVYAITGNYAGLPDQLWDGLPCQGGACDPTTGTPIAVVDGEETTGIDFVLDDAGRCVPDEITLCISEEYDDGRFRITVHAESVLGGGFEIDAFALPLEDVGVRSGGLFHFGNEENPEILVKVLDGCILNLHYWVFYSAATSVGFTLTVEDTWTGESATYENPDLMPALTVTDTDALPVCL